VLDPSRRERRAERAAQPRASRQPGPHGGLSRRELLLGGALASGTALGLGLPTLGGCSGSRQVAPSVFVGHGSPILAIDAQRGAPLARWGQALATPRGILAVSAHWQAAPPTLGATEVQPLVYDFYGFPEPLYQVRYPAPGAPEIARRVRELLGEAALRQAPQRGLDHGVWTPLVHLFPGAEVPVLQLSLPSSLGARGIFEFGRKLAPLRREGVLPLASGNITHNLGTLERSGGPTPGWASEFDGWAAEALRAGDVDALLDYARRAPALAQNHPTEEHWLPLFFALGAADGETAIQFPVTGFDMATLSRRCVQFG